MIHFSYGTKALREASAKLLFASMFSSLFALRKAAAQNENEFTAEKKNCNRPSKRRRNRKPIKPRIVRQIGIALFLKTSTEKGILQLHSERKCARNEWKRKAKNSLRSTSIVQVLQVSRDVVEFLVGKRFVRSWNCGSDIQSNGRIV